MRTEVILLLAIVICETFGLAGLSLFVSRMKGLYSSSNVDRKKLKEQIDDLNDVIRELQSEISEGEKKNVDVKEKIRGLEILKEQLSEESSQIRDNYNKLKKQNDELIKKLDIEKKKNIEIQKAFDEKAVEGGKEKDDLLAKNQELLIQVDKLNEQLLVAQNKLEKQGDEQNDKAKLQIAGLNQQLLTAQSQINTLNDEKIKLKEKIESYVQELNQKADEIHQWSIKYTSLSEKFKDLEKKPEEKPEEKVQGNVGVRDSGIGEQKSLESIQPYIPENEEEVPLLFKDNNYQNVLKNLLDISNIAEYLKGSEYEKANMYIGLLETYVEELKDAFEALDADEDEMATVCVDKFAKCFKDAFAGSIIEPVIRGVEENDFYADMLKNIYSYLEKNHIYSKNVKVGDRYEKMQYMEIIPKTTTDQSKHKHIDSILRLPFYARYTNEYGKDQAKLLCKGECVVLKAK